MNEQTSKVVVPLAITLVLVAVWLLPPARDWFYAFVKLEPMRMPYTVSFFVLLFVLLALIGPRVSRWGFAAVLVLGAVVGQAAGMIALFLANLFIPDGVERTVKTAGREGILTVMSIDFVVGALLGAWLLGVVSFVAYKIWTRQRHAAL